MARFLIVVNVEYNHGVAGATHYEVLVSDCSDHEQKQCHKHEVIDNFKGYYTPYLMQYTGTLKATSYSEAEMMIDWLQEDVLASYEAIKHDWSIYFNNLLDGSQDE